MFFDFKVFFMFVFFKFDKCCLFVCLSCNVKPNSGYCRRIFEVCVIYTKRGFAIEKEFLLIHRLFPLSCRVKVRSYLICPLLWLSALNVHFLYLAPVRTEFSIQDINNHHFTASHVVPSRDFPDFLLIKWIS